MDWIARSAFAAVLLGASAASFAGMNTWTLLGPEGGEVTKVVYNRTTPSTVYMIAQGGFYRSLDEGAHWQATKTDFFNAPADLDVDPTDQNRLYIVSGSNPTLIVSTDGGVTFNPINSFTGNDFLWQLEVASDGQTLYAVSGTRFFRSADRGASWVERAAIGSQPVARQLYVDPSDKDTVYAVAPDSGNTNALFVTHNGGSTWAALSAAAPAGYIYATAFSSSPARIWLAAANGIYVSSDAGQNFSAVTTPALMGGGSVISINPANASHLIIADAYGALFSTSDDGAHWTNITDNITFGSAARSIAILPTQPSPHVLAGGSGGLAFSTIGGGSWSPRNSGFQAARIYGLSANPTADRIYLTAGDGGVHYLDSGATTTTAANNAALSPLRHQPNTFSVPALLAQDGTPGRLFASLNYRIARSLDGGSTWSLTGYPTMPGLQAWRLTSSPRNPQVLLAGGNGILHRSMDGGDAWSPATSGLPANASVPVVAFAPSDPLTAYAAPTVFAQPVGQSFGVYRSTDAGLTWSAANTGISSLYIIAITVDPVDAQTVYASTDQKLWKSTNGGHSWRELPAWKPNSWGNVISLAIDPVRPQIIHAVGSFVVTRSIDGGEAWEVLREPSKLPLWAASEIVLDPRRLHILLVGTERAGVQQMSVAPDLSLELTESPTGNLPTGGAATYRYSVGNLGPFHATGVKLTLQVPASAQSVSVESSAGSCVTAAQTITCSLGALRAGLNATATLRFTPSVEGAFTVTGSVEADQPDVATGNNANTRNVTVGVTPVVNPPTSPGTGGGGGSSGGGGGGGGALGLWSLEMLALALICRRRVNRC